MTKKYYVYVPFESTRTYEVEAESIDDAIEKVHVLGLGDVIDSNGGDELDPGASTWYAEEVKD